MTGQARDETNPIDPLDSEAGMHPFTADRPRTRRSLLAGVAGAVAGLALGAIGRPADARAASGDPLILGSQANQSGTANTQVLASSTDVALRVLQQGAGTALMGHVTRTTGTGRGVYGRTDSPNGDGIQARSGASTQGAGAAMRAFGDKNDGLVASSGGSARHAILAMHTGSGQALKATSTNGLGIWAEGATGLVAQGNGSTARGVYGLSATGSGGGSGVFGESYSPAGNGVTGVVDISDGSGIGVLGRSASPDGAGVSGLATNLSGAAVGVRGVSFSAFGVDGAGPSVGVRGVSNGPSGIGIFGAGKQTGVAGQSSEPAGVGVDGLGDHASGAVIGVHGHTDSSAGIGVKGVASRAFGVTYGIHGSAASADGFAGWFQGAIHGTTHLELDELASDVVAPASGARLFVRDAGGNKSELCVRFPSGAVQVIAQEP